MSSTQNSPDQKKSPPLWKQLGGAVAGMLIALGMYKGYKVASPVVQAYLIAPAAMDEVPPELMKQMESEAPAVSVIEIQPHSDANPVAAPKALSPLVAQVSTSAPADAVLTDTHDAAALEDALEPIRMWINQAEEMEEVEEVNASVTDVESRAAAPNLPQSGIALWIAVMLALLISALAVPGIRNRLSLVLSGK